ncbi:MAG: urease accessory protein UreD [Vulcanococcus sp.]
MAAAPAASLSPPAPLPGGPGQPWQGEVRLQFERRGERTRHQGGASAPLKLQRAFHQSSGHCELPILHTAGGLVGGDQLRIQADLAAGSRALLTSVAAQKVYGSVARSRRRPEGSWARQELAFQLAEGSDLEWLPQELVLYADGLYEQTTRVELASGASLLAADVVRLGRTAAGERLGAGRWRSALQIRRQGPEGPRWELVDRLELGGDALIDAHGLGGAPVFGSLVWLAPQPLAAEALAELLADCRTERRGLEGRMACGALEQGIVARYIGGSSQAARHWFSRIWQRTRVERELAAPELPRVWPFQEQPFASAPADTAPDVAAEINPGAP